MTTQLTTATGATTQAASVKSPAFNTTYYRLEMRRLLRDRVSLFFTAGLPVFFYLLFGASPSYADENVGDGNVAMLIMLGMAAYGAVSATNAVGGGAAVERMQGWGRQLGLTPITDRQYVTVKAATAITIAAVPLALIFVAGVATGARAPLSVWVASGVILLIGAVTFALWGLCFGLAFRSEAAVAAAGGSLVVLSFLGNIFVPLTGWLLTVAKFTPLYGYASLARWPLTDGGSLDPETGNLITEPLWQPLTNVLVWTALLGITTVTLVRKGRGRQ